MSQILEIVIDGTPLDLLQDEEKRFYVTKQVHDLINLQSRNAEFTKTIDIPLTNNNRALIGDQLPANVRHSNNPSEFLPCEVFITGIPVIEQALLLVGAEDIEQRTVSCTIFGGSMQFFSQLRDVPISALGWHEFDMEWTLANLLNYNDTTSGIFYGLNLWFSNKSYRYAQSQGLDATVENDYFIYAPELDISGVWLFAHTVLDKIFSQLNGLTVDLSRLDDYYYKTCIAVPNYNPWEVSQNAPGTYSQVNQLATIFFPTWSVIEPLTFDNVVIDPTPLWDIPTNTFVIVDAGAYNVTLQMKGAIYTFSSSDGAYVQTYLQIENLTQGEEIGRVNIADVGSGLGYTFFAVEIVTSSTLAAGDVIQARLITGKAAGGSADKVRIDTAIGEGYNFSVNIAGEESGTFLDLGAILPDISQKDFVKQIFNMFDIIPITRNGIVELHYFDEIRDNIGLEENIAVNESRSINATLIGYAQTNNVKYADNDLIERLDASGSFPMSANDAPLAVTKIESLFSAGDDMQQVFFGATTPITTPAWDINYKFVADNKVTVAAASPLYTTTDRNNIKVGDYLGIDTAGTKNRRKVIEILDDFRGNVDVPFPVQQNGLDFHHWWYTRNDSGMIAGVNVEAGISMTFFNGGNSLQFPNSKAGIFSGVSNGGANPIEYRDLRWSALLANRYQVIQESVARPFTVTAWFHVPTLQFYSINGLEAVYVPDYQAYFYVNKWQQWKYNNLVRLELIQIQI